MKNIEETLFVELPNGKNVAVRDLDAKIQQHIKVLDKLRDDVAQKGYEFQVYQMALHSKKHVVEQLLNATYGEKATSPEGKTKTSSSKAKSTKE